MKRHKNDLLYELNFWFIPLNYVFKLVFSGCYNNPQLRFLSIFRNCQCVVLCKWVCETVDLIKCFNMRFFFFQKNQFLFEQLIFITCSFLSIIKLQETYFRWIEMFFRFSIFFRYIRNWVFLGYRQFGVRLVSKSLVLRIFF